MLEYLRAEPTFEELVGLHFRNNIVSNLTPEWFEWLYYKNPYGDAHFYCAYDGNQLVGTEVLIPLAMKVNDDEIMTALAINSLTDNAYRGRGIWKQLLILSGYKAKEAGVKVIWGAPNDVSHPILVNKAGWVYVCDIDYYSSRIAADPDSSLPRKAVQHGLGLYTRLSNRAKPVTLDMQMSDAGLLNEEFAFTGITVRKSPEYFKWRYGSIPETGYAVNQLVNTLTGEVIGILVYKILDSILYIFECCLKEGDMGSELPAVLQRICKQVGCRKIVISANPKSNLAASLKRGTFLRKPGYKILANILDDDCRDVLLSNMWQLNIGDEDIKFSRPFEEASVLVSEGEDG